MSVLPQPQRRLSLPGRYTPGTPLLERPGHPGHGPGAYTLTLGPEGAVAEAADPAGFFYARQTLAQIERTEGASIPACRIEDWPSFPERGVLLDVSRGRVPTMEAVRRMVDELAGLKVNLLVLYIEHTFQFEGHPLIGRGASPFSAAELKALDAYCAERFIALVPCLASLGHMAPVLSLEPYRSLAEDLGAAQYQRADLDPATLKQVQPGWTLAPGRPEAYAFLDSLYAEFLPCFRDPRFIPCCDEPFDLGWGQSKARCEQEGLPAVFSAHVRELQALAAKYGKTQVIVWADLPQAHPEALQLLPKDVVLGDWRYDADADFPAVGKLLRSGFQAWASPSTNSWGCFYPRLPMAFANIDGFAAEAKRQGVKTLLNTVWGDGGHFNDPACDWPALARGAERGWNVEAGAATFWERCSQAVLGSDDPDLGAALEELGGISALVPHGYLGAWWAEALFHPPGSEFFRRTQLAYYRAENGRIVKDDQPIDAAYLRQARRRLQALQGVIAQGLRRGDRLGCGPAIAWAIDAMLLGADKALGDADGLQARGTAIKDRYEALWLATSRPGGLQISAGKLGAGLA